MSAAEINRPDVVARQYGSATRLQSRISIHAKYSINPQGFGPWIVSHYAFPTGARVLELGCGTGDMWREQHNLLNGISQLVLTDLSEGMLSAARQTLGDQAHISYQMVDIQSIPFDNLSFDAVIANMMLYHAPDLHKSLTEVRRVLKTGGAFYCATYGEHGVMDYLCRLFSAYDVQDTTGKTFTLQNGATALQKHFSIVERHDYQDALAVTNIEDIIDYVLSLSSMTRLSTLPRDLLRSTLAAHMTDGILHIPKEYGMFICH